MAKANVTYIDAVRFELTLLAAGVSIEPQAGFVKVQAPNGHRMYVAKTKRVGRVDLAFKLEGEGFNVLSEGEKFGAIETQLDFSRTEDEIMDAFGKALEHMKALPKQEPKAKAAKAGGAKPAAQGWSETTLKATKAITAADDKGLSLALKLSLSANGKPLSKALIARLSADQLAQYEAKFAASPEAKAADKA